MGDLYGKIFSGIKEGDYAFVRSIVGKLINLDINAKNENCMSAFLHAAQVSDLKMVKIFTALSEVDVNLTDCRGNSALHIAIHNMQYGIARHLINLYGIIDVNMQNNDGNAPLHIASMNDFNHVIYDLISHRHIDLNVKNNEGQTPFMLSILHDKYVITKILLATTYIDVGVKDIHGESAYNYLDVYEREQAAKLLKYYQDEFYNSFAKYMCPRFHVLHFGEDDVCLANSYTFE